MHSCYGPIAGAQSGWLKALVGFVCSYDCSGVEPVIQSRKIRYFLAAADHLHFSAAAAELHISQPALSRSVRQLEERLGVPLFERAAKGVVLTRYGELLARRARLMELEAEHTLAEIDAIKTGSGGTLHVGAGPVWLRVFLPPAIRELRRHYPDLQIDLMTGVIETHLAALMNGRIDLLCGDLDFPNHPELRRIHLIDLQFVVICGADHPLARKQAVRAEDLVRFPWIVMRGDYLGRNRLGAFFTAQDVDPPKPKIVISPGVENFGFLTEGDYLAYIPTQALHIARRYNCVRVDVERAFWKSRHGVVYRRAKTPEASVNALVSVLQHQLRDRADRPIRAVSSVEQILEERQA